MPPKMRVKFRFFVINFLCPIKHSHAFIVTETVKPIHMYFSDEGIVVKAQNMLKKYNFEDQHFGGHRTSNMGGKYVFLRLYFMH